MTGVMFLQSLGYGGRGVGDILINLEQLGFFDYLLPFLIIFALVFGILTRMKIFGDDNRAINGVIALSVGLMALQFGFVSAFFSDIFPRLGVGLAIILVALVLMGFFFEPKGKAMNYIMLGVAAIIFIVILAQSAETSNFWYSGFFWSDNLGSIIAVIIFLAALGIIIGGSRAPSGDSESLLMRGLRGSG